MLGEGSFVTPSLKCRSDTLSAVAANSGFTTPAVGGRKAGNEKGAESKDPTPCVIRVTLS